MKVHSVSLIATTFWALLLPVPSCFAQATVVAPQVAGPAESAASAPAAAAAAPAALVTDDVRAKFRDLAQDLISRAAAFGLSAQTVTAAFDGLEADPDVLDLALRQPEHTVAVGDYVGRLVSVQRIEDGRQRLQSEARTLADIEAAFGVDRHVVLAIWGIESNYGTRMGERRIVRSLATLAAADERRGPFWRGELISALKIIERGDVSPDKLVGSWAGAMGHTQFIPSTFLQHAVDFDGDGRRDIWGSVPDALGSTAKYLKVSGWQPDRPCLFEVALPPSFDYALAAPAAERPYPAWAEIGVKPAGDGTRAWESARRLTGQTPLRLILPQGAEGPAFLVTSNFNAVLRYNQSVAYALAVCHLADRVSGGEPILAPWPSDDPVLVRADREDVQRLLTSLGYDIGPVDGLIGSKTQAAIRAYQMQRGLAADGYAGRKLLDRLRADARL